MEIQYKGKIIHPYESFYWNTTESFNRGELGRGICRCIKTDDSLATLVMEEVKIIKEGNYHKSGHNASSIVNVNGISPAVMENHGTVTAISEITKTQEFMEQLIGKEEIKYRIRKLTPRECFRLMGVKDEDYARVAENQSKLSLYHLAGYSIVVNVLMAIFKELCM